MKNEINNNYKKILGQINKACKNSNRDPKSIKLIAICKRQPKFKINQAIEVGIKSFGENRIQDASNRWSKFEKKDLNLSFVGPLQTNKSENAVKLFSEIQSLDRLKLVKSLSKTQTKLNKKINYMVQVNTGNEEQKSGIYPNEVDEFIKTCKNNYGLKIKGLMCIPPINENPALHFAFMQKLSNKNKLDSLSMGMSNDFETAIEFGATHIRVGSALFGTRLEKEEALNIKDCDQT